METEIKPRDVKSSDQYILDSMNEFEKSNLSMQEFCDLYEIDEDTFYQWQKRHVKTRKSKGIFIPVQPAESLFQSNGIFAEVVLPGGSIIKLHQQVEASWFKSLIG